MIFTIDAFMLNIIRLKYNCELQCRLISIYEINSELM